MISGIEVLGIALAVPPLITDAMDRSHPVVTPLIHSFSSKTHNECVEDFFINLHFEICMFHNIIQRLVYELNMEDDLKARLLEPSLSNVGIWENPPQQFQRALQERIGHQEAAFRHLLEKILTYLRKITKDNSLPLSLDQEDCVSTRNRLFNRTYF